MNDPAADFDDDRALAQAAGYHVTPPRAIIPPDREIRDEALRP